MYSLSTFYVIKLVKAIPSIITWYDRDFKKGTTIHYTIDTLFVVIFIKLNSSLSSRLQFMNYIIT